MGSDDDSRSSMDSSSSSSNGPASPEEQNIDETSTDRPDAVDNSGEIHSPDNNERDDDMKEEIEDNKPQVDNAQEDLSDISDLESSNDTSQGAKKQNGSNDGNARKSEEEELDFEDDDDLKDSTEIKSTEKKKSIDSGSFNEDGEHKSDKEDPEPGEELEDGEVTDDDEKRPEETETKPLCRFYSRGQCHWGMNCRFLHPGTTDKGNYTMFELVRTPMPAHPPPMMMPAYDYRMDRPPLHRMAPGYPGGRGLDSTPPESSWERGLRTAKEMMRKANERKEHDIDFDEKKMNLSGPPDEIERDPYYHRGSPSDIIPPYERERMMDRRMPKFSRPVPKYQEEDQYGRMQRSYRELPPHRMPQYEDDDIDKRRTVRAREVIVEKTDDWDDPWMRKRDSGKDRKARGRERSFSGSSSYSSSGSSSRSSSDTSRSPSPGRRSKKRPHIAERPRSRNSMHKARHSPPPRARISHKKKSPSPLPVPKRKKPSSPPPRDFNRGKKRNISSGSSSDSDSASSNSSSASSPRNRRIQREKPAADLKKAVDTSKKPRHSPPAQELSDEKANAAAKLKNSRREELLKQLRAVENAIARKRAKVD